jgi:hypothetical protein
MKTFRVMMVAALTSFGLAMSTGSASANKLSSSSRTWRKVWQPVRFIVGTNTVSCNVTLEGSFHSATMRKVERALIGHVTAASFDNTSCVGGHFTVLRETLPWHSQYGGFTGRLPTIEKIKLYIIGLSLRFQPGSLACLLRSTTENPAVLSVSLGAGGEENSATWDPTSGIPLESFFCSFAEEIHFQGTSQSIKVVGGTTVVSLKLI